MWGLGATLHHAVTGEVPFPREKAARDSDDPESGSPQLVEPPRPLPDTVPAELRELILSTLDKDPAERPPGRARRGARAARRRAASKLALSRRAARFS